MPLTPVASTSILSDDFFSSSLWFCSGRCEPGTITIHPSGACPIQTPFPPMSRVSFALVFPSLSIFVPLRHVRMMYGSISDPSRSAIIHWQEARKGGKCIHTHPLSPRQPLDELRYRPFGACTGFPYLPAVATHVLLWRGVDTLQANRRTGQLFEPPLSSPPPSPFFSFKHHHAFLAGEKAAVMAFNCAYILRRWRSNAVHMWLCGYGA